MTLFLLFYGPHVLKARISKLLNSQIINYQSGKKAKRALQVPTLGSFLRVPTCKSKAAWEQTKNLSRLRIRKLGPSSARHNYERNKNNKMKTA